MNAGTPGANMEDERPAMKVMVETRRVIDQRRRGDQLIGLVGLVVESQVTMFWSIESSLCSDGGIGSESGVLGSDIGRHCLSSGSYLLMFGLEPEKVLLVMRFCVNTKFSIFSSKSLPFWAGSSGIMSSLYPISVGT